MRNGTERQWKHIAVKTSNKMARKGSANIGQAARRLTASTAASRCQPPTLPPPPPAQDPTALPRPANAQLRLRLQTAGQETGRKGSTAARIAGQGLQTLAPGWKAGSFLALQHCLPSLRPQGKALQRPFKGPSKLISSSKAVPSLSSSTVESDLCARQMVRILSPPRAHFGIATEAGRAATPRPTPPGLSRWCCVGATTEEPPQRRYRHGGRRVVPCQCPRSGPMIMVMSMSRAGAVGEWGWGGEGGGKRRTPVSAAIGSFCGCMIGAGNAGASAST